MDTTWDIRFLQLAAHVREWSKDPRTRVGAVIVNQHKQVIGLGFNGFPRGVFDLEERYNDRETKLLFVAHAEQNALDNCFVDARGATLYTTLYPCYHCAKSIIQRGIRRVVSIVPDSSRNGPPLHLDISMQMFKEAGLSVDLFEDGNRVFTSSV